ncbi:MAG: substrate-binding domain-containing protein, partial [Chthoniobacteraceae bacterium]|nr:substrate-binding domain-containing protein [Chthoniobacteraceae bacterium]
TARRASQVLFHRGIRGLLVCPLPVSRGHLSLQWGKFAAVAFGYSLLRPKLHLFTAAHYRSIITSMRKLRAMGYRRIGMVTAHEMDERMDRMWTAAYRTEMLPQNEAIPIHFYSEMTYWHAPEAEKKTVVKEFLEWYRKYKPDAIITSSSPVFYWLTDAGHRVPEDVAVASATLQEGESLTSGIIEPSPEIGHAAADFLVSMLQRGEYGVPAIPQRVSLEGKWFDGKTIGKNYQAALAE